MRKLILVVMALALGPLSPSLVSAGNLPNTAACRDYKNFARGAGVAGTMVPLNRKYQACMRSGKRRTYNKPKNRCPNGYSKYYIGSKAYCKESGAKALDAIGTAVTIFSLFK